MHDDIGRMITEKLRRGGLVGEIVIAAAHDENIAAAGIMQCFDHVAAEEAATAGNHNPALCPIARRVQESSPPRNAAAPASDSGVPMSRNGASVRQPPKPWAIQAGNISRSIDTARSAGIDSINPRPSM